MLATLSFVFGFFACSILVASKKEEDMEYIDSDVGPLTHNAIKHFLEKGSEKHYLVIKEFNGEL